MTGLRYESAALPYLAVSILDPFQERRDVEELRADHGTRTLRLGASLLRASHTWMLLAAALGVPLLAIGGLVYGLESRLEVCPVGDRVWAVIWAELVKDPANRAILWSVAVLLPVGITSLVLQRRAYLRLTPAGIQAYVPRWLGLGVFRQTAGRWELCWDDVRRVRLVGGSKSPNPVHRLGWYRLVIETETDERWLNAFRWFDDSGPDHRLRLGELIAFRKLDAARRLRSAPLLCSVEARNLHVEDGLEEPAQGPGGFDLSKHKGMLAQVCLFFGAGIYAAFDTFFAAGYLPLAPLPMSPFIAVGVIAAVLVAGLGRGAPRLERLAIGVLTVAACVAAAWPATLRLNAATADAETVAYVSLGDGRFRAPNERLPAIDLAAQGVAEYWERYPAGSEHEFTLLRGNAGIYQLDLAPFYERTRQFYRER